MRCLSLHRTPSFRRSVVERIACLSLLLGGLIAPVRADDSQQEGDAAIDHPILVVAAASIDRLLERATTLLEVSGRDASPEAIQKMFSFGDSKSFATMQGIDTTKPIGVLVFFGNIFGNIALGSESGGTRADSPDDPQEDAAAMPDEEAADGFVFLFENFLDSIDIGEGAAAAIPMKNFDELLASMELTPIEGRPHAYTDSTGKNVVGARRSGNYLLVSSDPGLLAHTLDPRSLLRSVLGKQDVAVSFQTKGLPIGLRMLGAEGIKSVYAAMLQQRDDEPAHEYKLRRALGDLQLELLDLVVSHIDEVNLGARLDPDKREFVVEFDLAGQQDGKLAKFAAEWTPKRSPFAGLWQEDGTMSLGLSLAFPERHARPIAAALRDRVQQFGSENGGAAGSWSPLLSLLNVGTKLIETGQFEVLMTSVGAGESSSAVLGIKVPGGPRFPEQFQKLLELLQTLEWGDSKSWGIAADAVNGLPVHRISWNVFDTLFGATINGDGLSDTGFSIVATPDAIWLATTGKENPAIVPDLLKLVVEQSSSKSSRPAGTAARKVSPFRMTLHTREMKVTDSASTQPDDNDPNVRQAKGEAAEKARQVKLEQAEKAQREQQIIQTIFQEKGDAIHAELRPTSTGFKLTLQLEEALVALFGRTMASELGDSPEESE